MLDSDDAVSVPSEIVTNHAKSSSRHAALSIAWLIAIPVASVSSAALLAGPVSVVGPQTMLSALTATLGGVVVGLSVLRWAKSAAHAILTISKLAFVGLDSVWSALVPVVSSPLVAAPTPLLVASVGSSAISRRGPPLGF